MTVRPCFARALGARLPILCVFASIVSLVLSVSPVSAGGGDEGAPLTAATSGAAPRSVDVEAIQPRPTAPTVGEIYSPVRTHSPITREVVANLRRIRARSARRDDSVFAKLGASATVNRNFLRCFSGPEVDLGGRDHLEETIAHFRDGDPDEGWVDPFRRRSRSATVGWHAGRAVWGSPAPLVREVRAIQPRFAVVMYGTNDIELGRPTQYASLMLRLSRMLTRRGVIPIFSTIMPRDDDADSDRYVPLYNGVLRAITQAQRLPLIDLHRELARLPDHGIASDGVHPNVLFREGAPRPCEFTPEGLRRGYNVRNLLTIEALHRVRRTVLEGDGAPDVSALRPAGAGSLGDPITIDRLPFAHASDTARSPHRVFDAYPACGPQDQSGPEVVYHLELDEPAEVHAMVITEGSVDVDLHHLELGARGPRCSERADEALELELEAGSHYFAVDTFVDSGGRERAGEYTFVLARVDRPSAPPVDG